MNLNQPQNPTTFSGGSMSAGAKLNEEDRMALSHMVTDPKEFVNVMAYLRKKNWLKQPGKDYDENTNRKS